MRTYTVPAGTPSRPCRGCPTPIYWIESPAGNGKRIPVDCSAGGGTPPTPEAPGSGVNHFQTCPAASRFNKSKRGP